MTAFLVETKRMTWKPHVTVAAVVEQQQRFLIVEEQTTEGFKFNQPAGHLENGEDLMTAIRREVYEETAWQFEPTAVIGVQLWRRQVDAPSFIRVCFTGNVHSHNPQQPLDVGILQTHWLTLEEILSYQSRLRSPLVLNSIYRYLEGHRYPLHLLETFMDIEYG
ncbi:MAG: hypothetical protein RL637_1734 [Pseudomonadota bacterium]|jgi:8-oxo-dGTP pyrophosphatase MutT (NUDIX family)